MIDKKVSLKEYCSYKTGGKAELFCCPTDTFDLKVALKFASDNQFPITLLGTGYNVLISDKGVKGLVISTRCMNEEVFEIDNDLVLVGAGILLDDLILRCIDAGLGGLENMSGIPGSVGGAVKMNAGAFGAEIKDVAVQVEMCGFDGVSSSVKAEDAGFGYRTSNLEGIVVGLGLQLYKADKNELMAKRKEILAKREEKQPLEFPSCGSVFKRPEGNYAGALIEQCGLKGYKIGGAQVSEKHANFIINTGKAKSKDIYELINHVTETVEKETGVSLEKEVRLVGF